MKKMRILLKQMMMKMRKLKGWVIDDLIIVIIIVIVVIVSIAFIVDIVIIIAVIMMKTCAVPRYDSTIERVVGDLLVGRINSLSCLNNEFKIKCTSPL